MTQTIPLPAAPLLALSSGTAAPRVAVITGSYGAGHDAAAREIARVLTAAGCEVETHDIVTLLPWRLGPILRAVYYAQLRCSPRSWGSTLRLLEPGRPAHRLVTWLLGCLATRVIETTRGCDLVVTTHPFGAQALGHARLSGALDVPVATYLTDTSVHALWIHPGVDLNLAIHEIAAAEARAWGGRTEVVRPLIPERQPSSVTLRCEPFPGDIEGPWALVTGGSLGMGQLEATARDLLAHSPMTPVVLCGTDARLRRRLGRIPGVVALGWRDDIPDLMRACDHVVQNAGGFTSLEALASGAPVVTYRPLPGHGVANSVNLEAAGLIPWARTPQELSRLLAGASPADRHNRLPQDAPEVVDLLLGRVPASVAA
ncbi:galactosyldiacylglycerol synthase [Nocardioides sp. NPDC051685]|uniref:MGDG synthase family glycosyltransferase n=1 Tax=Nocardioides sp. NPDC051685 TaxID=3364334 RepID=UPI00378B0B13